MAGNLPPPPPERMWPGGLCREASEGGGTPGGRPWGASGALRVLAFSQEWRKRRSSASALHLEDGADGALDGALSKLPAMWPGPRPT